MYIAKIAEAILPHIQCVYVAVGPYYFPMIQAGLSGLRGSFKNWDSLQKTWTVATYDETKYDVIRDNKMNPKLPSPVAPCCKKSYERGMRIAQTSFNRECRLV